MQKFLLAEKKSDTQILLFGTDEIQKHLISGWSGPENDQGTPFRWAVSQTPVFAFELTDARTLYLHLRVRSQNPNHAEITVNSRPVGGIEVDNRKEYFAVAVPEGVLFKGRNTIEFHFSSLYTVPGRPNNLVAAAFYGFVVSPSKYVVDFPKQVPTDLWTVGSTSFRNKQFPSLVFKTGGSFHFYEKLNRNARLRFGFRFHPSPFSEKDDFASFTILLRKDGDAEKQIFHRRLTEETLQLEEIALRPFVSEGGPFIYEIEFRLDRSSVFDLGQTEWIQPGLVLDSYHLQTGLTLQQRDGIEALHTKSRNANVLLIVLDAAGAKHFGCYGYPRNTTPTVDRLAKEGIQFMRAYSEAVFTLASTATLMSGLFPDHHRILYFNNKLPAGTLTLAEVFRENGYETATFVANGNASGTFGMTQGFETAGEVFREKNYTGWGQDVTDRFAKWLDQHSHQKFFVYLHYREPHDPFNPPEEWIRKFADPDYRGTIGRTFESRIRIKTNDPSLSQEDRVYIQALYDANLAYGDWEVDQVLKKLQQHGVEENTIVIVTADHGEAFWEHGFQGHNSQLYEESVHIPLVFHFGNGVKTEKIDPLVRTVDVFPTLIDLLHFSRKAIALDGLSFLPYFVSAPADGRTVVSQTLKQRTYSYLDDEYKYLMEQNTDHEEMYNLEEDPFEQRSCIAAQPVRAGYYRSLLLAHIAVNRAMQAEHRAEQAVLDEAARENLKALGYIEE